MRTKSSRFLTLLLAFLVQITFAQEKTISGNVTDQDGLALPGANIIVKGTSVGTQTDFDGNYSINTSVSQTLVFSFIGQLSKEIVVGNNNVINVQLAEDAQALGEVVVTALGVSRDEKSLTYSAPVVQADEITAAQNSNVASALSSKVAGLQINSPSGNLGGSQRILIRGANSVTGENQPLFIVDGVPMDNSSFNTDDTQRGAGGVDFGSTINDINPNDIESVTVLKGPAAALYGSRASNGVILIKTKTGKNSKKLGITINSSLTFSQVDILPDLQNEYGGGATISDANGGRNGFATQVINGREYLLADYATDESWGPKYDSNINVLHWDAFDQNSFPQDYLNARPWVAPKSGVRDFFTTGITSNNGITISSGSDKGSYLFSFAGQNTTGTVPNTDIKKYSTKVSLTQNLSEKLTATAILNYSNTKGKRPVIGYDDNSVTQKLFQWGHRQLDYDRLKNYKNDDGTQRTWNRISWDDSTPNYSDNPYWILNENNPTDERSRIYGSFGLNYQITDEISIKGFAYGDTYRFQNSERVSIGSQAQSKYLVRNYDFREYNYELIATYNKQFSDNFSLSALIGGNKRDNKLAFVRNETTGGLSIPGIFNIANGLGQLDKETATDKKKVNSAFGSLNLAFANQVFLDLTARNDWSSSLPDDNNSYFYPSASLAWVFSDALAKNSSWFNYGKLRLGWAQVGNDTDPYNVINTLTVADPFNGTGRVTVPSTRLNPGLKSETTTTWEVGTELGFMNGRVNLDVTYYENETTDQIIPVDLSFGTGYGANWINTGKMTNKGVEVALGIVPVRTEKFKWEINATFAKNESKLNELTEGLNSLLIDNAPFQAQLAAYVGQAYGVIMGTDFIYDSEGNKVVGGNGIYLATSDLVPLGTVSPEYTAGLRNSFKYKNIDLSILLGISKGGSYFSTTHQWGMFTGTLAETAANNIREDGIIVSGVTGTVTYDNNGNYTVTGTAPNETVISAESYGNNHYGGFGTPDAQNVFDADYMKIRELTLGYTLTPTGAFDFFESARISFFGRNLLTWGLDYDGIDPETVSTSAGNTQGLEGGLQPSVRSYGMSLQLSF